MGDAKEMLENLSAEDQTYVNSLKDVEITETDLLKQEKEVIAEMKASFDSLKVWYYHQNLLYAFNKLEFKIALVYLFKNQVDKLKKII